MRLDIASLAYGGAGIARSEDGRVVFVAGACPGDTVEAVVTKEHPNRLEARVDAIIEPSQARVKPPCPYADVCGGCQWQHIAYASQLEAKRTFVADALQRLAGLELTDEIAPCVPSPLEYGYRNKIELAARTDDSGLHLGYTSVDGSRLVEVDSCLLLPRTLVKAPRALRGALRYATGTQDLGITRVGLRAAHNTKDVEIALWTPPSAFPRNSVTSTLKDALRTSSITRVLYREPLKARDIAKTEVLDGKGSWRERLGGLAYAVSAPSFFQVNTRAAEELVAHAIRVLDPSPDEHIVDLYAGVGTFTLPLAESGALVSAVESGSSAISDLRRNLERAELHAEVVPGDVARVLPELGDFDGVVVDPPRAGLAAEAIAAIADAGPERIVYVSCDPTTLARDAARLSERGYRLTSATPFDLFPQTYHVETVAQFSRD